jgi:hypothetical protein
VNKTSLQARYGGRRNASEIIFPEFDGIGPDSERQELRRTPMTAGGDDGNDEQDNRQWRWLSEECHCHQIVGRK